MTLLSVEVAEQREDENMAEKIINEGNKLPVLALNAADTDSNGGQNIRHGRRMHHSYMT